MKPSKSYMNEGNSAANQLMAALSMLHTIKGTVSFGEFVCQALKNLPAIELCAVCLRGTDRVIGDLSEEAEKLMKAVGKISDDQEHFSFTLPENENRKVFLFHAPDRTFGYLFLYVKTDTLLVKAKGLFEQIEPIIQNFISVATSELERRWHSSELTKLRNHLSQKEEVPDGKQSGMELSPAVNIIDKIASEELVKKSSDALKESEEHYRTMIETSNDLIWILDLEGNFVFINKNALKKTGFIYEEWIGKSFVPLVLEEELPMIMEVFQKGLKGASSSYLFHLKKENGDVLVLSVNTAAIKKNNVVTGMVSFGKDITDDLRLQEKVQSYQKLFEDSRNEIYFFHIDTYKFLDVNKAALINLGFSEDEILALTLYDINPEFNKKGFHKLVLELKNQLKEKLTFTTVHKRKNGSTYPVEVHLQLSRYRDISAFVAIIIDITDRVKAAEELKMHHDRLEETVEQRTREIEKQSKKLKESQLALTFLLEDMNVARKKREETNIKLINANKELESFSYSVSHDLRAPLRAIVGFSAKFKSQYSSIIDDEGKRLLGVISKNAMKMGHLIDDLLAFSRMSRTEIRKLTVDMRSLAEEAWLEVAEQAVEHNVQLELKVLPHVNGDHNMLKQVYVNILSNAIKFSKPNERNVIEVGSDIIDGKCIFYVKDNGVGFDMKYIEKLFQVFQRLHSEKEFEGTGVGLALVHRIISKHEGEIWAEAEVDKGAKFSFTLPV